jgi:hypothetical protein
VKPARSDAALLDIRKALERRPTAGHRRPTPKLDAWIEANVAKRERARFKNFLFMVDHLGDVNLKKAARRVGVSKELLDKWMDTPEISKRVNRFLNGGRRVRAGLFVGWANFNSKVGHVTRKGPLTNADGGIPPDCLDFGNMLPLAKDAAGLFQNPRLFRERIDLMLKFHEYGGLSSAKQFFIDLGKCLSHGAGGTQRIKIELWDTLDLDIADIILSHNPPMSDRDAVRELQNRGHPPMSNDHFRVRKHRLILNAHAAVEHY